MRSVAVVLALALVASGAHGKSKRVSLGKIKDAPPSVTATTQLLGPSGELRGTARLEQRPAGTQVVVAVEGMAPGTYGVHLHAVGKCDAPDFKTAGGHFNPANKMHGHDNPMGAHAGDLPNVVVGADGHGTFTEQLPDLTLTGGTGPLLDADGAAVVVHAGPDDYKTDPSGNSGARIACGVIAEHP